MDYATFSPMGRNLVVITWSDFNPSEAEFEKYLTDLTFLLDAYADLCIVMDLTKVQHLSSKLRVRQGNWFKEHKPKLKSVVRKWHFVVNTPLVKFMLKGIFLVSKPPVPYAIFNNIHDAQQMLTDSAPESMSA